MEPIGVGNGGKLALVVGADDEDDLVGNVDVLGKDGGEAPREGPLGAVRGDDDGDGGPHPWSVPRDLLGAGLPSLVMAFNAFRGLGKHSLWTDEGATAFATVGPFSNYRRGLAVEPNFALYHTIVRAVTGTGDSELMLRLPSAVFATLTVPVVYAIARRLFGRVAAVIVASAFAVNGFVVSFAQEARPYAMLVFVSSVATLLLVRAFERPVGRRWLVWSLAVGACVLTHPLGATVVVAHLAVLVASGKRVPWGIVLHSTQECLVGMVLLVLFLRSIGANRLRWVPRSDGDQALSIAGGLTGGHHADWPLLVVALAALGLVVAAVRHRPTRWPALFVGCWVFVPLLVTYAAQAVQPLFVSRYLIAQVPALAVLAGAGLSRLRLPAAVAAAAALVASMLPGTTGIRGSPRENWRGAVAIIEREGGETDTVVPTPLGRKTVEYYFDRDPSGIRPTVYSVLSLRDEVPACLGRVWIVGPSRTAESAAAADLVSTHTAAEQWRLTGLRMTLFEPNRAVDCQK